MKTTKNNAKEIKANMKNIAKLLNTFCEIEDYQLKTRNARDYDLAGKTMQVTYDGIIHNLNQMISTLNTLGCSCGRLDIKDYMLLKKEQIAI
jgi:hypothetical protein